MNQLYPQNWMSYLSIASVFLRLMGFFLLVPGFSSKAIPNTVKVIFCLSLSLALFTILKPGLGTFPETWGEIAFLALKESGVGLLMGFVCSLTFEGIHLAAQFIGYQMGFGTAGLMDPQTQSNESLLVPLHTWLALLVLFFTDMHHELLKLFVMSYTVTQNLTIEVISNQKIMEILVTVSGRLFLLAIQMAAPFTLLILAVNAAIGVLARLMPQMNVMLFSFPVTILLGFGAIYLLAPEMIDYISRLLDEMSQNSLTLLKTF